MRLVTLLLALLLPADHWWLGEYGFDEIAGDGTGVLVAVIDTGIDDTHPDLANVVVSGKDFSGLGNEGGTLPVGPASYHGTMVASLIAGQGKSTGGVIGVAPGVRLISVSIGLGVQDAPTDDQIAQAVIWATDQGANVINLSLTRNSRTWPESWDEAFLYALERDVVIVAASGNSPDGTQRPSAPAVMPGVISVGGLSRTGSASGTASTVGLGIDLMAPAEELYGSFPGGEIRSWSGASAATPLVTGLVALMRERDPDASASDIIQRLLDTATDLGDPGFDSSFGFGAINPLLAMESAATTDRNPLGDLASWIELYRPGAVDEPAELVTPEAPESVKPIGVLPIAEENQESISTIFQSWWSNPLIYLVLAPLAALLWYSWRRKPRSKPSANSQEGNS